MAPSKYPYLDKYGDKYRIESVSAEEASEITKRINEAAKFQTKKIIRMPHAMDSALVRNIEWPDVEYVLECGRHKETRVYEKRPENPRFKFVGRNFDDTSDVAVILVEENDIIVITVWDPNE